MVKHDTIFSRQQTADSRQQTVLSLRFCAA